MKKEDFDALVQGAREGDLVQYFQRSGYSVERKGREYYVKEFPGLCIKPETNQWYDHYTAKGAPVRCKQYSAVKVRTR